MSEVTTARPGSGRRARVLQHAVPQVLQSGTTFIVTLAYAHLLHPRDFGYLSAVWLVWMLVLSFNRTVLGEQLISRAHVSEDAVGYGSLVTLWLLGLTAITAIVAALLPAAVLAGVAYIVLFVASDAGRYRLMYRAERGEGGGWTLLGLEVPRILLALLLLGLALAGNHGFLLSALAILTGGLLLLPHLRDLPGARLARAREWTRRMGSFEAWMSAQFFTLTALQQLLPLLATRLFSAGAFGSLRLTQSITSPGAILGTAFQPILISAFARRESVAQRRALLLRCVAVSALGALVVSALAAAIVLLTGRWWIPPDQADAVRALILPALVAIAAVVVGQPAGALIRVMHLGRVSLLGQLAGVVAALVSVVLLRQTGITGFAWALAIGNVATDAATYAMILPRLRKVAEPVEHNVSSRGDGIVRGSGTTEDEGEV